MVVDLYEARPDATIATTSYISIPNTLVNSQLNATEAQGRALSAHVEQMRREIQRLERARRQATTEAGQLRRRLHDAARAQSAMVPRRGEFPGLVVNTLYRPIEGVSGDVFALERLEDGEIALSIADVSGHGIVAAMMAPLLQSALAPRWHDGCTQRTSDIAAVMRRANHEMLAYERRDGLCATAIHARFDAASRRLAFARAGHPHPILLRPGCRPKPLLAEGLLLGALADADWDVQVAQLAAGDRVVLHTDGLEMLLATNNEPQVDGRTVLSWLAARRDDATDALLADLQERCMHAGWDAAMADDVTIAILTVGA